MIEPAESGRATDLEASLSRFGTDEQAVVASVDAAVGLGRGDVLLGVGSLVEGLGTSKSDLDLLLISAGDGDADAPEMERAWRIGRCIVDLRVVRSAVVKELSARLREWAWSPWNVMQVAGFSHDERILLHRLLRGRQLFPAQREASAAPYRPPRAELARLKLQVARHMARTIQVDMVGYRDNLDYSSLVFAAQELLGHAVDGLLAGHHLTNPSPKWRSRLLDSLPTDWDRWLAIRPTGLPAGRAVWNLHRAPAEPERGPALAHALRCATFARAVFSWAEPRLVESSVFEQVPYAWRQEECRPLGAPLPNLELDVDFCLSGGSVAIARLNEFGNSLQVSERELALLLLFDGETTPVEAEIAVGGSLHDGLERVDVGRVVELAIGAGLCVKPQEVRDFRG